MENPLLIETLPSLAKQIKMLFKEVNRDDLLSQIEELRIKAICECGEPDCGSFYLTYYAEVEDESQVEGFAFNNIGTIEVHNDLITFVEIFPSKNGNEIRTILKGKGISY